MRKLIVDKKTGFDVTDIYSPIIIRDHRGILFYSTEPLIPKVVKFNLPMGVYYVDRGSFREAREPREYPKIKLPHRQRYFFANPANFEIRFGANPNKCTVNWDNKYVLFDNSFKDKPLSQIDGIFFHECGHRFYTTEKFCDIYSVKCMLNEGYNPSQIGSAFIDSLSDAQEVRKEYVIDSFI